MRTMRYAAFLFAFACIASTVVRARQPQDLRPGEVAQAFVEAYNAHDASRLVGLYASTVHIVTPDLTTIRDPAEHERYYQAWFESVPDVHATVVTLTVDGEVFALELRETGTYRKRLPTRGAPRARGQKLSYPFVVIGRVREGKIASLRFYENDLVIEKQLGIR